jgi:hypothetical protein
LPVPERKHELQAKAKHLLPIKLAIVLRGRKNFKGEALLPGSYYS